MKIFVIALVICLLRKTGFTQTDTLKPYIYMCDFCCIEIPPKYPGGHAAMRKFFTDNARYPKKAERRGMGGKIIVQYTVDTLGNTIDIKVVKGIREDFDMEAVRLIRLLKGWRPATINGHKTSYYLKQPFTFKTENNMAAIKLRKSIKTVTK